MQIDFKHLDRKEQIRLVKELDKMTQEELLESVKMLFPVIKRIRSKAQEQIESQVPDNVIPFPGRGSDKN